MGSTTSKATRAAAAPTARKYPSRIPPTHPSPNHNQPPASASASASAPDPTAYPSPSASTTKTAFIASDAADPDFAASLRSLGPVNPHPTLRRSTTFTPRPAGGEDGAALLLLQQKKNNNNNNNVFDNTAPDPAMMAMNPAVRVLAARARLAAEAEREFARVRGYVDDDGDGGGQVGGRRFLDVFTLRRVLVMRDEKGMGAREIERAIGLVEGVVGRLGPRGVVGEVSMGGGGS